MENPLLEEVPARRRGSEETATEEPAAPEEAERPAQGDRRRALLRGLLRRRAASGRTTARRPPRRRRSRTRSRAAGPLRPPPLAAPHDGRGPRRPRDRPRPSSGTWTRTGSAGPAGGDGAPWAPWPSRPWRTVLSLVRSLDPPGVAARGPSRSACASSSDVPGPRGLARRRHGARPHQAAPEPPVPRRSRGRWGSPRTRWRTTSRSSRGSDPSPGNRYSGPLRLHPARRVRGQGGGGVQDRPQRRRPAQAAHQPHLPAHARPEGAGLGGDARLRQGQAAQRALADQERRPAAAHHLQGGASRSCATSASSSTTASRTCGPWSCGTWPSDIGMHESTVSRVVANKYMHTPRGVYELRFFFHSGITSTMGEAISSVRSRTASARLIDAEDAARPLSDSAHRRGAARGGAPPRPPHRRQVPRGAAHPALEPPQDGPRLRGPERAGRKEDG